MASASPLNESQQRRLLSNARYADKLLSDIEAILNVSESKTIFPKFRPDTTPAQAKLIRHSIARFRDQLARVMEGLGIVHEGPAFGSLHSIRVTLGFIRIAIQEMTPRYLRGYGEVAAEVAPQLEGLSSELEGLLERLDAALAQDPSADLQARLQRLQTAGGSAGLLQLLGRVISDRGLVELRPRLATIVERMESGRYEIAIFGRVSAGKSSLLNHVLGTAVLPVGVNPITAVPTRLIYGREALLTVSFSTRPAERLPIARLPEFVSETHNPANTKGVVRLVVELPSERLSNGLGFVDTPGLGSLATAGAAETLAYLPQCDLGVVLVSAGSPLNDEDLETIGALYESAIPVKILLSKADLLSAADLEAALAYTAAQVRTQLGVEIGVHPVSSAASHAHLLDAWFDHEIAPLYQRHQELLQASIRRKTGALRESVVTALRTKLNRAEAVRVPRKDRLLAIERGLREAAGKIENARKDCLAAADAVRVLAPRALDRAADSLVDLWSGGAPDAPPEKTVEDAVAQTAAAATVVHGHLQELARTLAQALERAAEALDSDDAPAEEELAQPLREMPRFDPPPVSFHLRRPWIAFPRAFLRRLILRKLRSGWETALSAAFATHAKLVENWSRKALLAIQTRFDASADVYRAQLARLGGQGILPADEKQAIQEDLALLEGGIEFGMATMGASERTSTARK